MLYADLMSRAALDSGIVVVNVVELNLYYLDLRIIGQNPLQHLRTVVE